ncbi:coagulation factor X-like [Phlebotomus papatasi]|uniref:coagulation factor X-like n=1 Tax=Phlebotomus papatasi TaxID=29031 RepID=UPI0024844F8B|nr:coagulation factor X-like [Phlebotomus papatasi]
MYLVICQKYLLIFHFILLFDVLNILQLVDAMFNMNKPFFIVGISYPYESSKCGIVSSKSGLRIFGGKKAKEEYPWFVLLKKPKEEYGFCGGSLITKQHVLTAAHCYTTEKDEKYWKNEYVILFNIKNVCKDKGNKVIKQDRVIIHPGFNSNNVFTEEKELCDIAVIRLEKKIRNTIVCLPKDDKLPKKGIIIGFGATSEDKNKSCELQEAYVNIPNNKMCGKSKAEKTFSKKDNFCAKAENSDSCKGDSGGPLVHEKDGQYVVYGIVSLGYGCGRKNATGFYTNIISHLPWIKNVVKKTETIGDLSKSVLTNFLKKLNLIHLRS